MHLVPMWNKITLFYGKIFGSYLFVTGVNCLDGPCAAFQKIAIASSLRLMTRRWYPSGKLKIKRFRFQLTAFCETYIVSTAPLRFRTIAIPLLEFHSNDQRPRRMILWTILLQAHSRVANESILCGCGV